MLMSHQPQVLKGRSRFSRAVTSFKCLREDLYYLLLLPSTQLQKSRFHQVPPSTWVIQHICKQMLYNLFVGDSINGNVVKNFHKADFCAKLFVVLFPLCKLAFSSQAAYVN
jgi:hypothetical protein